MWPSDPTVAYVTWREISIEWGGPPVMKVYTFPICDRHYRAFFVDNIYDVVFEIIRVQWVGEGVVI